MPGNYPLECWERRFPPVGLVDKDKLFGLVVDIDGFTDLASSRSPAQVGRILNKLFWLAEESFLDLTLPWPPKFRVNKYVGDGLFGVFDVDIAFEVVRAAAELLERFRVLTDGIRLVAVLDVMSCLAGGVGGGLYYDYSYWGPDVNRLFKATKGLPAGEVWMSERAAERAELTRANRRADYYDEVAFLNFTS